MSHITASDVVLPGADYADQDIANEFRWASAGQREQILQVQVSQKQQRHLQHHWQFATPTGSISSSDARSIVMLASDGGYQVHWVLLAAQDYRTMREEGLAAAGQKQPNAEVAAAGRKWQRVVEALKFRLRALQDLLVENDAAARRQQQKQGGLHRAAVATPATAPPAAGAAVGEMMRSDPPAARTAPPPAAMAAAATQGRAHSATADAAGFAAGAERMANAVDALAATHLLAHDKREMAKLAAAKAQRADALSPAAGPASAKKVDQPPSASVAQARGNPAARSGDSPAAVAKEPAGPLQPSYSARCCTASVLRPWALL